MVLVQLFIAVSYLVAFPVKIFYTGGVAGFQNIKKNANIINLLKLRAMINLPVTCIHHAPFL
jgi:hypothetical protein